MGAAENHRRLTIEVMHRIHGQAEGTCAECQDLIVYRGDFAGHYYKCRRFRVSNSASSDWRKSWPACGAKNQPEPAPSASQQLSLLGAREAEE